MKIRPTAFRLLRACALAATVFLPSQLLTAGGFALAGLSNVRGGGFITTGNGLTRSSRYSPEGPWAGGRRPLRPMPGENAAVASTTTPASPSGRVPGDGGFAGVNYKQEDPLIIDLALWQSIAVGADQRAVQKLLGEPDVKLPLKWFYPGDGWLAFDAHGHVTDFGLPAAPRTVERTQVAAKVWATLQPGMTKEQIAAHLGEPGIKLTYKWFYGTDRWIAFDDHGVARGWGESKI